MLRVVLIVVIGMFMSNIKKFVIKIFNNGYRRIDLIFLSDFGRFESNFLSSRIILLVKKLFIKVFKKFDGIFVNVKVVFLFFVKGILLNVSLFDVIELVMKLVISFGFLVIE